MKITKSNFLKVMILSAISISLIFFVVNKGKNLNIISKELINSVISENNSVLYCYFVTEIDRTDIRNLSYTISDDTLNKHIINGSVGHVNYITPIVPEKSDKYCEIVVMIEYNRNDLDMYDIFTNNPDILELQVTDTGGNVRHSPKGMSFSQR